MSTNHVVDQSCCRTILISKIERKERVAVLLLLWIAPEAQIIGNMLTLCCNLHGGTYLDQGFQGVRVYDKNPNRY